MSKVLQEILSNKIIAIVRRIPTEAILPVMEALQAGGIRCVEITFDHQGIISAEETAKQIRIARENYGNMLVGAGTVLSEDEAGRAYQAGASFILSPNVQAKVIHATKKYGMVSIPGAYTPTEIVNAASLGADIVKVFPADVGGAAYIKAILGPLSHIKVSAVGGVTPENVADFLKAGAVCAGIGGNLVSPQLVMQGLYHEITAIAKQYIENAKKGSRS